MKLSDIHDSSLEDIVAKIYKAKNILDSTVEPLQKLNKHQASRMVIKAAKSADDSAAYAVLNKKELRRRFVRR